MYFLLTLFQFRFVKKAHEPSELRQALDEAAAVRSPRLDAA
jgi:hypothetical protein